MLLPLLLRTWTFKVSLQFCKRVLMDSKKEIP